MDVNLPEHLYKYLPLDRQFSELVQKDGETRNKNGLDVVEQILLHGKIHYSKPSYFNDPFEIEGVRTRLSAREKENITNRTVLQMRANHPPDLSKSDVSKLARREALHGIAQIEEELEGAKNGLLYRCGYISLSGTNDEMLLLSFDD